MKSVIDDLYFGRINPCDRCSTPEERELMEHIDECYEKLAEGITEEQRTGLENFKDYLMEIGVVSEREMLICRNNLEPAIIRQCFADHGCQFSIRYRCWYKEC